MNSLLFRFLAIVWLICSTALCQAGDEYPTSDDPQEFSRQAEEFFIQRLKLGGPLINPNGSEQPTPLKDDKRDWESVLARIHGDPAKYGFEMSQIALNIASLRGTAKDPKMIEATSRFWEARVREADERYEHYAAQGKPKYPLITSGLGSTVPRILRIGAAEHLSSVLAYFNSSADERNGLIFEKGTPREVAEALRNYGNESHVEAAKKFAQKLRDVGRDDLADDIGRSIKRIEKEGKRSEPNEKNAPQATDGKKSDVSASQKGEANHPKVLWPWLAATGALLAAAAAYFRMKRSNA